DSVSYSREGRDAHRGRTVFPETWKPVGRPAKVPSESPQNRRHVSAGRAVESVGRRSQQRPVTQHSMREYKLSTSAKTSKSSEQPRSKSVPPPKSSSTCKTITGKRDQYLYSSKTDENYRSTKPCSSAFLVTRERSIENPEDKYKQQRSKSQNGELEDEDATASKKAITNKKYISSTATKSDSNIKCTDQSQTSKQRSGGHQ
ncbi:hypothetical protein EGW08_013001, partial [Elysia chlorotica]